MHGIRPIDGGRAADWGRTSSDYAAHRPGPPASFYSRLKALGIGLPGQRVLDLGTGTGLLARQFARQGCRVAGIDIAAGQVDAARRLAAEEGLDVAFAVAPAEETGQAASSFDAVTASQCWLYFDKPRAIAEVKRVLAPGGVLVTSHFSWLPRLDAIARRSEDLVLQFNPQWGGADWAGAIPAMPQWAVADFNLTGMLWYDEDIPFTAEAWRGRMRACRGVGATLSEGEVERFDAAHAALLQEIAGPSFTIRHRIDAHIFQPK